MANMQLEAFGELFQSEEAIQRFRRHNYACPFDDRVYECDKPNRGELRYGNCTAKVGDDNIIICPRRFYENNFEILRDVKNFIWNDKVKVECYDELHISSRTEEGDKFHFGNLDWLLVNQEDNSDFCGVEIQTDATTGTGKFRKGIEDLLDGNLAESYNFGLNTLASFKGFLPQFIFKGQLFDDWKKPYVAIMQDELWKKFITKFRIRYREIETYTTETFLFFIYTLEFGETDNKYHIGDFRIFSTRWIDLLFSFSVENELLLDLNDIIYTIERKKANNEPIVVI